MKVFAIRDHDSESVGDLAYLFFYEKINEYYIEINKNIDYWDLPFILDSYVKKGFYTLSQSDTLLFISQRIIPKDRQNIGQILKENGLDEYDEMKLLILADGRCAQDECYIRPITYEKLPDDIKIRRKKILVSASATENGAFLLSHADGTTAMIDLDNQLSANPSINRLMAYKTLFTNAVKSNSGSEILFPNGNSLTYEYLHKNSTPLPFSADQLLAWAQTMIVSTQDITDQLHCSRQNINDLVKRGKIKPLNTNTKEKLFSRAELLKLI